ncbi:LamG domain-containing protein [Rhodopirellula sp. JC740]|uniref:LamG domain-containing protein n=1 Tax=Rhodopirellula halodulae TaxID=2894198 RepID=A0ABS8NFT7_9BACT|nr:LamG domain-containing protein [Rhodopirellula sp. JC740]MCC9642425.1 LamG domain-containing protein [Rhodopirellula sp. JC740]
MNPRFATTLTLAIAATLHVTPAFENLASATDAEQNRAVVKDLPGLVAFWDFSLRETDGSGRFIAHVPPGTDHDYALDAANYVREYWGEGREATYDDFPQLSSGPFNAAIRIRKESDPNFRPFLYVPRSRLHDTPLDIKGEDQSVTVVVWAIRESGNHALAGIWHEGTDLKQSSTATIKKVERGQRQYALFAGLNQPGSACGHVSENGASSFLNKYALHKCNSLGQSPTVSADAPAEQLAASWQCFAMTFNHQANELTGWLNGIAGDRWLKNPASAGLISYARNAYLQGHYARTPGLQPGEDINFPSSQTYNPPEDTALEVETVSDSENERIEKRRYRYTEILVTLTKDSSGEFVETDRDLVGLSLNPWWYPHGIYSPGNAEEGGPFTIGRVIHSSRSVGFTGWIGGVSVFNRALSAEELKALSELRH